MKSMFHLTKPTQRNVYANLILLCCNQLISLVIFLLRVLVFAWLNVNQVSLELSQTGIPAFCSNKQKLLENYYVRRQCKLDS